MILPYKGIAPKIDPSAYIAESADIIGRVSIGPKSSVWFNAVARADINEIIIGTGTNIQDGCLLHVADEYSLVVGDYVTVGHGVNLHACKVGNGTLIGMGAIILNGAEIGEDSIIGAGALVAENKIIPPRCLAVGSPARVLRELKQEEIKENRYWAEKYISIAEEYKKLSDCNS